MFIKKNKEKKTTFGSDLSFSFRGTAYTRKVLLYLALSAVFILFFSPLHSSDFLENESRNWIFSLFLQRIFLRIWKRFRQNYSVSLRNPLVFLSSSSYDFAVCDSLFGAYQRTFPKNKKKTRKKNGRLHLHCPPLRPKQQRSFSGPAASVQTSSQQKEPSMFSNRNAAHCMLFVYLNPGPRLSRLCHHFYSGTDWAWK